jgi:hypothetical protein
MKRNKAHTPEIGAKMEDGMLYAGVSPTTGKPLYIDPEDAPLQMDWYEATKYAAAQGKRLPTEDELAHLFFKCAVVGGFKRGGICPQDWYWGSSERTKTAYIQSFLDRSDHYNWKDMTASVRLVRN